MSHDRNKMDSYLKVRDLVKRHSHRGFFNQKRGVLAVDRVSFDIRRNTVFGLVGESGCGKTTLAKAVLFLDPPDSGDVCLNGTWLGGLSKRELRAKREKMQIVFQDPNNALDPRMKIRDSMEEGLANRGVPKIERKEQIQWLLELVGIPPSAQTKHPHEYSSGQKQRIVLARALGMKPDFLILDEPVSNLDVSIQAQIINLLLALKDKFALTYLFVSHDLNLVSYICDTVAVMYCGRIVELAPAAEIVKSPVHSYTQRLFSSIPSIHGKGVVSDNEKSPQERSIRYPGCEGSESELMEIGDGHFVRPEFEDETI